MNKKKLAFKDRLTIRIKKTKPAPWPVYLVLCALLLAGIVLLGNVGVKSAKAPKALKGDDVQLRITVGGDIKVDDSIRSLANKTSYKKLLKGVSTFWKSSDYVVANLSGPVLTYDEDHYTSQNDRKDESIYLRPAALRGFQAAGINLPNFANAAAFNYGHTGITSTITNLDELGMKYLGIGAAGDTTSYELLEYTCGSEKRQVAVMGFNDKILAHSTVTEERAGVFNTTMDIMYQQVNEAAQKSDAVIVYVNFGENSSLTVSADQKTIAHALIDAGASIVVGTSTETVQPIEKYGEGLIVYGIGSLVSSEDYSNALDAAMMDYIVDKDGEISVYLTPLRITEGCPEVTESALFQKRIQRHLTRGVADSDYTITSSGAVKVSLGQLSAVDYTIEAETSATAETAAAESAAETEAPAETEVAAE